MGKDIERIEVEIGSFEWAIAKLKGGICDKIRREDWPESYNIYLGRQGQFAMTNDYVRSRFFTDDIFATDWEIIE